MRKAMQAAALLLAAVAGESGATPAAVPETSRAAAGASASTGASAPAHAPASALAPVTLARTASAQEIRSFADYLRAQSPAAADRAAADFQPEFAVTRTNTHAPWSVQAALMAPSVRGVATLCRASQTHYQLQGAAWKPNGQVDQYAWLEPAAACREVSRRVRLVARVPDVELLELLSNAAQVLEKSRLFMAGNTQCAVLRNRVFTLAAIDVGALGAGTEWLYELLYRSDLGAIATVQVKRDGRVLAPWNVACPA